MYKIGPKFGYLHQLRSKTWSLCWFVVPAGLALFDEFLSTSYPTYRSKC